MQIADDLQIAESTMKSRLHHALRVLRLTLRPPSVVRSSNDGAVLGG
jgi:DNA-directed RNA polymerase specialized sigma24 family protein